MVLILLQGDVDVDGMDVNVCGLDGFILLMLVFFCGGVLELMLIEEDEVDDILVSIIFDLICQGVQFGVWIDCIGEIVLYLVVCYVCVDVVKWLLDVGVDINVQDYLGCIFLYIVVIVDVQGVFQIFI